RRISVRVWGLRTSAYRCATSPVIIGNDVVGTITIGLRVTENEVQRLHAMTNSDIYLLVGDASVTASSVSDERREIEDWIRANIGRYDTAAQDHAGVIKLSASS